MVTIKTSKGDIAIKLFEEEAPETVKNFLKYVENNHYNDTIFHRVIDGFMVQGGGFDADFEQKPTMEPIKNEAENRISNKKGTLAMARTANVDSATCQFFINLKDNNFLDHRDTTPQGYGYCVFGEVEEGMDIVDAIKAVETETRGMHSDVPVEDILILDIIT